jgi:hypothetical protein
MSTQDAIPQLDAKALREFGLVTGAIVVALFGLLLPWLFDQGWPIWPWAVAAPLVMLALVRPLSLRSIYHGWMRFGLLASRVTTPIILGIVFFLLISPMALFRRFVGQDQMRRSFAPDSKSYRVLSEKPSRNRLEKPY